MPEVGRSAVSKTCVGGFLQTCRRHRHVANCPVNLRPHQSMQLSWVNNKKARNRDHSDPANFDQGKTKRGTSSVVFTVRVMKTRAETSRARERGIRWSEVVEFDTCVAALTCQCGRRLPKLPNVSPSVGVLLDDASQTTLEHCGKESTNKRLKS